jgi:hypothetical protein
MAGYGRVAPIASWVPPTWHLHANRIPSSEHGFNGANSSDGVSLWLPSLGHIGVSAESVQ